jgi:N-acetyl-anhydromuramyl-L-alanine amidase AmpD
VSVATMPFIQARNFTRGRSVPIDVLVVHTMESPEKPTTAEDVARWFAGSTAPQASAHYCIDSNSIVQCVKDEDVAWHAPGANHNGLGFEHAGCAAQTAADWEDAYSTACLELSAQLAAQKCAQYGIPAVWLDVGDLQAGKRGVTGHVQVSEAFKRSDHRDPGTHFPVDSYLGLVRRHLGEPHNPQAQVRPTKTDPRVLRTGAHGWQVTRLQRLLKERGFDPKKIDGVFGADTRAAVLAAQGKYGLDKDGVVGPKTWHVLETG